MKKILFVLPLLLFIAACGEDIPSAESGKKIVEEKFSKLGCLKLVGFNKDDGLASEADGVKKYELRYTATVELESGCYGYYNDGGKGFYSLPKKERLSQEINEYVMAKPGCRFVKEGEQVQVSGVLRYIKSEKGWHEH